MATGRDTLDQILDQLVDWANNHGEDPKTIHLPVGMAWDLAKCGRGDLGDLSGKIIKEGIAALEKEGLFGLEVKIVREKDIPLRVE